MLGVSRWSVFSLQWVALLVTFFISLPLMAILYQAFFVTDDASVWQHITNHLLKDYVTNSILILLGVGIGVFIIGLSTAWLVTRFNFPGRRFFDWALLLPLAMPSYIIAYTYTGMLDFSGPVQTQIRAWTGWQYGDYWFWQVRSLSGIIVLFSLVLYPYVYLSVRAALLSQAGIPEAVARTLGCTPWQTFYRVSLPLVRPALIVGLSLALMETLAEYGAVHFFGVATFTTGIFRSFYGMGSFAGASQLALSLLGFVVFFMLLESFSRKRMSYFVEQASGYRNTVHTLSGWSALGASLVCLLPFLLGFLVPFAQLLWWTVMEAEPNWQRFMGLVWNTFSLAFGASVLIVVLALLLSYAKRYNSSKFMRKILSLAKVGYALPGTIVALGVLIPLASFDRWLNRMIESLNWDTVGLVFSGSLFGLLLAYSVRFVTIGVGNIDSGLSQVGPSIDQAGKTLGHNNWSVLAKLHIPMIRVSILTAFILVFVDILKELPATLILRPFNFNTLAVRTYELASDEQLVEAAPAAITIVLVGIVPILILNKIIRHYVR